MKRKRIIALLGVIALIFGATASASAAQSNWNLHAAFTQPMHGWCTYAYDYGTTLPNDDVRAQGTISLGSDMDGLAYVAVWGEDGGYNSGSSMSFQSGYIYSGWITVAGHDYASQVNYDMSRYVNGVRTRYDDYIV